MHIIDDFGEFKNLTHGLISGQCARERYRIHPHDPTTCRADIHWTQTLARDDWSVRTETRTELRTDGQEFFIKASIEAFEGEKELYKHNWYRRVKRDLF